MSKRSKTLTAIQFLILAVIMITTAGCSYNYEDKLHSAPLPGLTRGYVFYQDLSENREVFQSSIIYFFMSLPAVILLANIVKRQFAKNSEKASFNFVYVITVLLLGGVFAFIYGPMIINNQNLEDKFKDVEEIYENETYESIEGDITILSDPAAADKGMKISVHDKEFDIQPYVELAPFLQLRESNKTIFTENRHVIINYYDNDKIIEIFY